MRLKSSEDRCKWSNMYLSKFQKDNSEDEILTVITTISFLELSKVIKLSLTNLKQDKFEK